MVELNSFVSDFCQWANHTQLPRKSRSRLATVLRRAINVKLMDDDAFREVVSRQLIDGEKLNCQYFSEEVWCYKTEKEWLEVGVVGPAWRRGWTGFDRDEHIINLLSGFFHFAGQYVLRGRIAKIIGAIVTTYDTVCDFRYGYIKSRFVEVSDLTKQEYLYFPTKRITSKGIANSRSREFNAWVNSLNGLDPYIQRGIYQYWRASALMKNNFLEEAVTAFDGLISISAQFVQNRFSVAKPRDHIASRLMLSKRDEEILDRIYQLRCIFGAHPSPSKWWDFSELFFDELDGFRQSAKTLLWKLCEAEQEYRTVDPSPKLWSVWFNENAQMLFNTVWFKYLDNG